MRGWRGDVTAGLVVAAALLSGACGTGDTEPPQPAGSVGGTTSSGPTPSVSMSSSSTRTPSSSSVTAPSSAAGTPFSSLTTTARPPTTRPPTTRPPTTRPATTRPPSTPPATVVTGLPSWLRGKDLEVMPTTKRVVALTFDGGSDATGAAAILATLGRTGTPATFFLTGAFTTRYPSLARQLSAGYRIGNHTESHVALTTLDDAAVRAQITRAEQQIRAATGADPRPWFRFPFGDRDARTIADVNSSGYAAIRWTVDSLGWKGTSGGQSVTAVRDRVLAAARPGAIVLMHLGANPDDGTTLDADALPAVISGLTTRGYTMVDLDTMLG